MSEPTDVTDNGVTTRRQLDTERDDPATRLVEIIADHVTDIFSSPPPEADARIAFS